MEDTPGTSPADKVRELGKRLFSDEELTAWLNRKNPALDDRAPITFLGNEEGSARVSHLLQRMEYGVLS